jgi:hypothetical protein
MKIDVVTIFPEYLAPLQLSLLGKAQDQGIVDINVHDLRTKATDNHHAVDDTPPIKNKHNSNPRGYVHPLLEASQSFLTDKN